MTAREWFQLIDNALVMIGMALLICLVVHWLITGS